MKDTVFMPAFDINKWQFSIQKIFVPEWFKPFMRVSKMNTGIQGVVFVSGNNSSKFK